MTLNKDIEKFERAINYDFDLNYIDGLYKRIYLTVGAKINRLNRLYHTLNFNYNPLPKLDAVKFNENELKLLKVFNGWDIDVVYNWAEYNDGLDDKIIYFKSKNLNEDIPALRFNKRIIFKNPRPLINERTKHIRTSISDRGGVAQSWGFPQINTNYVKHLNSSKNANASKYLESVDRARIEWAVFDNGLGFLNDKKPIKTMFLYASFSESVGFVKKNGKQTKSNIVKVQVDRVHSLKKGNASIHGFPISECELYRELLKDRADYVLENSISL
ncbi:hypothetical protein K9L67_05310 [Candidatus Woesearchaeota archaeon]|nr:hypothetical protein [Candidatus Woesearchaeota archaeon]MCF7901617.1 hypothetical protein [Candidatus Woesearchaeota archaeon]